MLARNWWVPALRGLFAIIFGALALIWPGLTLFVLIALFGAYAIAFGILLIILAFRLRILPSDDQTIDASRAART
jgi:uncharacterized membrane protein HdeD (DUF308 family)